MTKQEELELIAKQKRISVKMIAVNPKDKTAIVDNDGKEVSTEMSLHYANKYYDALLRSPKPTQSMYMPCQTSGYELDLNTNLLKEKPTVQPEIGKKTKVETPVIG